MVCEIVSALSGVLQLANVRGTLMLGQHSVEHYGHPFGPPGCSHMMLEDVGYTYKLQYPSILPFFSLELCFFLLCGQFCGVVPMAII
jgi:hypothetical protein